ncbi:MAG TPA: hypothetical protein PKY30_11590 [Myxococcota bacterium]|nr:hypothetical protein [Myxococcota bacterium]
MNSRATSFTGLGAVTMHGYFAHPSSFTSPGSRIAQESSLGGATMNWWRTIAATRILEDEARQGRISSPMVDLFIRRRLWERCDYWAGQRR